MNWMQKIAQIQPLYHGTTSQLARQIQSTGLMTKQKTSFEQSDPNLIYLTTSPEAAFNWAIESFVSGNNQFSGTLTITILRVDPSCIDKSLLQKDWTGGLNYSYPGDIPAQCISTHFERDVSEEMARYLQQLKNPSNFVNAPSYEEL